VCAYKDIVEAAAAKADAECRASMMQHFTRCCQLEWMFWDAALQLQSWPKFENSN
jgi:thiaminase